MNWCAGTIPKARPAPTSERAGICMLLQTAARSTRTLRCAFVRSPPTQRQSAITPLTWCLDFGFTAIKTRPSFRFRNKGFVDSLEFPRWIVAREVLIMARTTGRAAPRVAYSSVSMPAARDIS
jgi:hypothetical protein